MNVRVMIVIIRDNVVATGAYPGFQILGTDGGSNWELPKRAEAYLEMHAQKI